MPQDESGAKWACEPCVRGHRATRCDHFDRWMVRVKKPGRPLRECTHNRKNCECSKERVIMVQIPTESMKCLCRIQRREIMPEDVDPDNSRPVMAHHDPRIQFPYVNYEGAPQFSNGATLREEYQSLQAIENGTVSSPIESYSSPGSTLNQDITVRMMQLPVSDPNPSVTSNPSLFPPSEPQSNCCHSPTAQGQQLANIQGLPPTVSPAMPSRPRYADSNYLHRPIDQQSINGDATGMPVNMMDASMEPDFSGQTINYHFANNDPVDFNIGSSAASAPDRFNLDPNMFATHNGYHDSQHFTQQATEGRIESVAHAAEANHIIDGVLHRADPKCSCGPDCQCVYCSIHPYNEPTRARVRELASIIATDTDPGPESRPQSQYGEQFMDLSAMYPLMQQGLHSQNEVLGAGPDMQETLSQPSSHSDMFLGSMNKLPTSPIGSTSNGGSDNRLRRMEFSASPWCHDEPGTCMCGDDCDSIGCVTHSGHNGISGIHSQPDFTNVEV